MKPVEFPQQTIIIAKNQPEYMPLPAHVEGGVVTSCWQPSPEDLRDLALHGKLYVSQCTFGAPLQPLLVQTTFNPPKLPPVTQDIDPTKKPELYKLADISHMRGLSGSFLFLMDPDSVPGKTVCHFVRFESIAFDDDAAVPPLRTMSKEADPRCQYLAAVFTEPQQQCVINLLKTLKVCADALEIIITRVKGLPEPLMAFMRNAYKTAMKAFETYG